MEVGCTLEAVDQSHVVVENEGDKVGTPVGMEVALAGCNDHHMEGSCVVVGMWLAGMKVVLEVFLEGSAKYKQEHY